MVKILQTECDEQVSLEHTCEAETPAPNLGRFTACPIGHTTVSCLSL
jgi:hypothetical protein